jgi:hypothetical protein
LADAERKAYDLVKARNVVDAKKVLQHAVDQYVVDSDDKGTLLQRIAKITYTYDQAEGLGIQQDAYRYNMSVCIPPMVVRKPVLAGKKPYAELVKERFLKYQNPNAAIASLQTVQHNLNYGNNYRIVERNLAGLGLLLGAEVSRPDHDMNIGPDVLWLWGSISVVIEAKNENQHSLHKKDAGQMMQSLAWYNENYAARESKILPVVAAKITKPDNDAIFPNDCKVLDQDAVNKLITQTHLFLIKLIEQGPVFATVENIALLMNEYRITPNHFESYLKKIG